MHILDAFRSRPAAALPRFADPEGAPAVLLVHDWTGLPEDMAPLARSLAGRGWHPVVMDLPATDARSGEAARLSDIADAIAAEVHAAGHVAAIVAHGIGASALLLALGREKLADNVVLVGLDRGRRSWSTLASRLGEVHGLLIHSADDADASLHDALEIAEAWPNSILARMDGLGHRRVLLSPATHSAILRFLDIEGAADPRHA